MGLALAHKRGELPDVAPAVKKLADSMSDDDLHDFAATPHAGLPKKASDIVYVVDPTDGKTKEARLHPFEECILDEFFKAGSAKGLTVDEMTTAFLAGCALKD